MPFKGLLIAVVALGLLGGGVYWSNKAKKAEEGAPAKDAPPKILTIAEDQFKEIRLEPNGGESIVLKKNDAGKWQMDKPKPLPADQDAVTAIVTSLSSLNSDRLVEDKASDLTPYGLNAPTLQVTVTKKDGKSDKLLVGDDTPTGGGSFAKLESDPRVFTIASFSKSGLSKSANDLRDKRLLTFDSEKLTRVELTAKGQTMEFGKNAQNDWQILKPKPYRADGSQVEELVRKLRDAKMDLPSTDDEQKKIATAFNTATKVATASVSDAAGAQSLEVRKDKEGNYYSKSSVVEGAYKIAKDLGDGFDKDLTSFRNKKLFDFSWSDPSKIEANKVTYQKTGDKWMSGTKQMDSPSVQSLIDKLRDLMSPKFVDNPPTSGTPVFEVTVTSNEGKRVEKVSIFKQGASYVAKRENEPAGYELDTKAVEDLQKAAAEVKEFTPPKDQKKDQKKDAKK